VAHRALGPCILLVQPASFSEAVREHPELIQKSRFLAGSVESLGATKYIASYERSE